MRKQPRTSIEDGPGGAPAKNWLFTDFTETDELNFDPMLVSYLVAQRERCPETGRLHWQGYFQLKTKKRLSTIKNQLNWTACLIKARGSAEENYAYCTKTDTRAYPEEGFVEWGTMLKSGTRTDLIEFKDAVKSGASERELVDSYTHVVCMYPKFYEKVRSFVPAPEHTKQVILHVGYTGKGKTSSIRAMYRGNPEFFFKAIGNQNWWTRYDRHKYVLWDEFSGRSSCVPLETLLAVTSEWPQYLETKGGETLFCPEILYITSNIIPSKWYNWTDRELQYPALLRRFTEIRFWEEDTPRDDPIVMKTLEEYLARWPLQPQLLGRDYGNGQRAALY